MQLLRFALQPAVQDISVTWDLPKKVSVTVLSQPITALFHGQRSLIYAQLTGQVRAPPSHSGAPLLLDFSHLKNINNNNDSIFLEFRGSRRLCDGEIQPGRSSLSGQASLQSKTCRGHWVKQFVIQLHCFALISGLLNLDLTY